MGGRTRSIRSLHLAAKRVRARQMVRPTWYHRSRQAMTDVAAGTMVMDVRIDHVVPTSLAELADVMVDAFATEGITGYAFDLSRGRSLAGLQRAQLIDLESALDGCDHVLVARRSDRVVGGAILSRNDPPVLHRRLFFAVRWLFAVVPMLTGVRWRHVPSMKRATSLPRPLVGTYFMLMALAVQPLYQGLGIGKSLLEAVHRISDEDRESLGVYLYTGDPRSRLLYERAGYRTIVTHRLGPLSVYHMFRTNRGGEAQSDVGD